MKGQINGKSFQIIKTREDRVPVCVKYHADSPIESNEIFELLFGTFVPIHLEQSVLGQNPTKLLAGIYSDPELSHGLMRSFSLNICLY